MYKIGIIAVVTAQVSAGPAGARQVILRILAHRCFCVFLALAVTVEAASAQDLVSNDVSCPACRIIVTPVTTIGDSDGPGSLVERPVRVGEDNAGRYWVLAWNEPPGVFSSSGAHLATIGRRGAGPGEFRGLTEFVVLPADSVGLIDIVNRRFTVVDESFTPAREVQFQGQIIHAAVIEWPYALIVNSLEMSRERIGWPLHLVDMSDKLVDILASFGANDGAHRGGDPAQIIAPVAATANSTVWSAGLGEYRFYEWDANGSRVRTVRRRPDWFRDGSFVGYGSPTSPPPSYVVDISTDSAGDLWIWSHVPSDTWREAWPKDLPPGTTEMAGRAIDTSKLFDTIVEVIDPENRTLVSATRLRGVETINALTGGRVAVHSMDRVGVPQVRVIEMRLVR